VSIVYTADVFCDGDDCSLWVQGVSATRPPTKAQARAEHAPREGWTHIKGKDYCRRCARAAQLDGGQGEGAGHVE
jgi:hypothetical protein